LIDSPASAHFFGQFRRAGGYARGCLLLVVTLHACGGGEASALHPAHPQPYPPAGSESASSPASAPLAPSLTAPTIAESAGDIEDQPLDEEYVPAPHPVAAHPLAQWSAAEIQQALTGEPERLGPMSVGAPNGGALFNAVQLPEDPRWQRVDAAHAWGTQETVDAITRAVAKVHEEFPDSPPLPIGHLSGRHGGHLNPHRSHQSGTDVDLGFFYRPEAHRWYVRGTRQSLDLPRTWALVRALVTETDVRFILLDHSIQALLLEHATSIGEDRAWLSDLFKGRGYTRPPMIRHAKGHATHLHVRFYSPIAEETGRRCYAALLTAGKIKPSTHFVSYKAKKGDTLLALAKRFGTTVKAIKRVNGLRSNTILAKRSYKIPSTGHSVTPARPVEVPPRRLPPTVNNRPDSSRIFAPAGAPEYAAECDADDLGGECE
jgi:murein endopeptidase